MGGNMRYRTLTWVTAMTLFAALAMPVWTATPNNSSKDHKSKHQQYKFIDLGTFGGPASYFPNGFDGFLNNKGTAAGWADTSTSDPYSPFCANADCFVSHA